jgi:hypothetical protein
VRLLRDTAQPCLRLRRWAEKLVNPVPVSLRVIRPETTAALKAMAAQLRQAMPTNWENVDEEWDATIEIMNRAGIPLIWIPRGSIVGVSCTLQGRRNAMQSSLMPGMRLLPIAWPCLPR